MLKPTGCIKSAHGHYDKNPVMQVIGQHVYPIDTDAAKDTQMILNAYRDDLVKGKNRGEAICNLVIDVFLLGMIYGKREERQNRRERRERREQATA